MFSGFYLWRLQIVDTLLVPDIYLCWLHSVDLCWLQVVYLWRLYVFNLWLAAGCFTTVGCRLLTSVYEAVQIHSILYCRERAKDLTPLWFLYLMSVVQFLQVKTTTLPSSSSL